MKNKLNICHGQQRILLCLIVIYEIPDVAKQCKQGYQRVHGHTV